MPRRAGRPLAYELGVTLTRFRVQLSSFVARSERGDVTLTGMHCGDADRT